MKFVIWGATQLGRYLANNAVYNGTTIRPEVFIDSNPMIQGTMLDDVPIMSYEELIKTIISKNLVIILALKSAKSIFQVLNQLESSFFFNIGILKPQTVLLGKKIELQGYGKEIMWSRYQGERYQVIPRIEVNLIDACNLKCNACTHFSSLYNVDRAYSLEIFKKDLLQVTRVGSILRLRLLGGEPFLLENLDKYIDAARKITPYADIEVVTNGLLIPEVKERILIALKNNDIGVVISPYQPTLKKKNQIVECLNRYGILWQFDGTEILQFSRGLTLQGTHNEEISNKACTSSSCTFLRNGKIYKCPLEGLINDFYDFYGITKKYEGGTDIYQGEVSLYDKLIDYALRPVEMCKFCAEKPETIPWSVNANPDLNDWLYDNGRN